MSTFRARITASASGVPVHNVLHVAAGTANPVDCALDLADAWRSKILPQLHSTYQFSGVELVNIATEDAGVFSAGSTGPVTGGSAGSTTALPAFVCASVRLQTGMRGRAGAGRLGLGPLDDAATSTDPNRLTVASQNAIQAAMDAFRLDIESSTRSAPMILSVVSYYKGVDAAGKPIKRATPLISSVTSVAVNSVLGTRLSRHVNR